MLPSSPIEQISRELSDLGKRIERLERLDQVFTINPAETVINEAGIDRNLRVEGDTYPNLLFIDAGLDRIGMNNPLPSRLLHLIDDVNPQITELLDAGTNNVPPITVFRHSTSAVPIVGFGMILALQAENDNNLPISQTQIKTTWLDPSNGAEDSAYFISLMDNGALRERFRIRGDSIVIFNVNNDDINTRFETTGSAFTLFVDGGRDNVGMGTGAPNASAILDLTSTTGSLLIPRMTTAQRNALAAVNGMGIYNTSTNQFEKYQAGAWVAW